MYFQHNIMTYIHVIFVMVFDITYSKKLLVHKDICD